MARKIEQILDNLPAAQRAKIEERVAGLATLKDLRQAMQKTQEDLSGQRFPFGETK